MDCKAYARVPRDKVLRVCDWALSRIGEIRREKDREFLERTLASRNLWRRCARRVFWRAFEVRLLTEEEVHESLLRETDSFGLPKHNYPWRSWREEDFADMRTLARDCSESIQIDGRDWCDMMRWCRNNGWRDGGQDE